MRPRIHASSLAVAADGTILVNLAHMYGENDGEALLRRALDDGGALFVGVSLRAGEARAVRAWMANAAAEIGGHVVGRRCRRAKGRKTGR